MPVNKLPTLALESNAITADLIAAGAITAADISDGEITAAKLHTTLDFSTKTFTMHNNHVTQAMVTQHQAALSLTQSQISDLSTTSDLTEGTNLYYTDARADARAQLKIDALVDSAPNTLDTLNELASALGDDANFSTTVTNSIATKLPLSGGTMTGVIAGFESTGIDDNSNSTAVTILSDGTVGIGTDVDRGGILNVDGTTKGIVVRTSSSSAMELIHADNGAGVGPYLYLNRPSSSPAANDQIGQIVIQGKNSADEVIDYVRLVNQIINPADGSEQGRFAINTMTSGTMNSRLNIVNGESVFNDESIDVDFRVESNVMTHALFVRGSDSNVGINTTGPDAKLHVNGTFKLDGNYPVGTSNVIIGDGAGENIASGGSQHTAVGNLALYKVASTNRSTAVGDQAGRWSEGYYNTFIGAEAGKGANGTHTSNSNIAIGTQALQQITTGSNNVAIGAWTGGSPASMAINSSGAKNTAVGVGTLGNNTTASNSTAIGFQALQANNANDNTAVGFEAMLVSDSGGATENTAIGSRSMKSNRTGDGNTAAGRESLLSNVSGGDNVAIGKLAMAVNNSGSQNVAVGNEALRLNSAGSQNVAVGRESAYNNNSNYTTIVGHQAGYTANNTAATFNTLFGYQAGYSNISGSANTFIGPYSGYYMTGNNNTILGRYNGNQDGLDIRTSSNNVVLSDGAGNIRLRIDTNGKVGINNTSPLSALAIYDSGASAYSSTVDSTSNMSGIRLSASPNQNVSAGIWFGIGGDQTGSHWSGIAGSRTNYASDWGTRLSFYTHPTATTSASETYERMTIDPSGNVGIGTTSPEADLHVDGSIVSTNLAQGTGQLQIQGYGATGYINMNGSGSLRFRMGTSYTEHMSLAPGGQLLASAAGRYGQLNSNAWVTFGRLYSAQSTPLRIKVIVGHNSSGGYNEFTNDTYAYNIAAGTVVTIGNTTGSYTCQIRKIKRIGGDYNGGDGGWEYQVARNQAYTMSVGFHVMGATTGWTWTI